jgi:hypothetical protein
MGAGKRDEDMEMMMGRRCDAARPGNTPSERFSGEEPEPICTIRYGGESRHIDFRNSRVPGRPSRLIPTIPGSGGVFALDLGSGRLYDSRRNGSSFVLVAVGVERSVAGFSIRANGPTWNKG